MKRGFNRDYDWKGDRVRSRYRQLSPAEIRHWQDHQNYMRHYILWGKRRALNDPYTRSINPEGRPWHPSHFPYAGMDREYWADFKHYQWMAARRFRNRQGEYLPRWIQQKIMGHAQHYPSYGYDYHSDWYKKWYGDNPPSWREYRED